MIILNKSKVLVATLVFSLLVISGGVKVFAESKTMPVGPTHATISSNAYQYYADAATYAADPSLGMYCEITLSQYTAKHTITGALKPQSKGPIGGPTSAVVSFYAPSGYITSTIATSHYAYYAGYTNTGNTADSY